MRATEPRKYRPRGHSCKARSTPVSRCQRYFRRSDLKTDLVRFRPSKLGRSVKLTAVVREGGRITSGKVERTSLRVTDEDSGAGLTLVEIQPFLGLWRVGSVICSPTSYKHWITHVGVPVKLTKSLGLKFHDSSSNSGRNREVGRIDLPESTALSGDRLRGVLVCAVDV